MIGLSAKLSSTYSSPGGSQNTPQIASGMELDADPSDWDQVRATSAPQSDPVWAMGMGMSGAVSGLEQCLLNFLVFLHRGIFCFCNMFCNATSFVCVCDREHERVRVKVRDSECVCVCGWMCYKERLLSPVALSGPISSSAAPCEEAAGIAELLMSPLHIYIQ